jgi:hypothetical protein
MTQAFNLSQLANNLNSSGQLDATDGLVNAVPVVNGGTGASSASAARTNLAVPSVSGSGATGTWDIDISGNSDTTVKVVTTNWTVEEVSGQLLFKYGGVTKFTMDQTNGFTAVNGFTAA